MNDEQKAMVTLAICVAIVAAVLWIAWSNRPHVSGELQVVRDRNDGETYLCLHLDNRIDLNNMRGYTYLTFKVVEGFIDNHKNNPHK